MRLLPASPTENSLEGRAFIFSAFATSVLSIVLYGQEYVIPAVGLAVAGVGHVVSYRGRGKPRRFWGQALVAGLIFAALAYFLADSVAAVFGGVLPQANFAILLVAITSFDLKTRRNCYSSLWISLAILYLAAVYAWDYPFGVLVALWAVCLAGFWAFSNLRRMGARPTAPVGAASLLVIGALALGVAGFVFIPQPAFDPTGPLVVSLPSYASFKGEMESAALPLVQVGGDASAVDLRYRGRLGNSPVMYVRTGAPAYWRGLVFDTYKDGVWTASKKGSFAQFPPYVPPRLLGPAPPHNSGTFVQTFRMARTLPGVINAAYPIQSLYAPVTALRQDAYGTFRTPDVLKSGMTYSVVSYIPNLSAQELQQDPGSFDEAPEGNRAYLDVGPLSIGAQRLALDVVKRAFVGNFDKVTQYDFVMALTTYLQKNYEYSLELGHVPPGRDPVDWFLFDVKVGYCEQFATAEVLMLRRLGIPARMATGYATGDYDPVLNQAVVRERDAHAWVEVWFPDHGWVPFDPTPGVSGLAATRFPNHWAGGGLARLIPHLSIGAPAAALGSLGILGILAPALAVAVVVTMLWIWMRNWRRRRLAVAGPPPLPGESELLRLYERLQDRLGRRRAPPETPLEYSREVGATNPEPLLEEVTHAVNEGAYAGRWPALTSVRELSDRLS